MMLSLDGLASKQPKSMAQGEISVPELHCSDQYSQITKRQFSYSTREQAGRHGELTASGLSGRPERALQNSSATRSLSKKKLIDHARTEQDSAHMVKGNLQL
jgi:hypothetical protein